MAVPEVGLAAPSRTLSPDNPQHLFGLSSTLVRLSHVSAIGAVVTGSVVILGYLTRQAWAVELAPSLPPMYPNAALPFVIGGSATLLAGYPHHRAREVACSGFLVLLAGALLTLWLHVVDAGPTFMEALWPDDPFIEATTPVAGRPVAETCVAVACVGLAGALFARRAAPRLAQGLALGTVSVGAAVVMGFLLGVDRRELGGSFVVVGMALHTGVGLALLGLGVLLAQPTAGVFAQVTRSGPSAELGRRLLVVVVAAPIALTAATAALVSWLPDALLAQSVAAIAQVLALGLLVMLPLGAAERVEAEATDALRAARRLAEAAGEHTAVTAALTELLVAPPTTPPGWHVGFRQEVAFAELPGDTCQILRRDDGCHLLALIDVAGHGTTPALQALRLRTEVASLWRSHTPLADLVGAVNESVVEMGTIATGVFVELDAGTGNSRYVNAGHPPIVVLRTGATQEWGPTGPLLGLPGTRHRVVDQHVGRGGCLVAYTDGVTEARAADRSFLGEVPLQRAIRDHLASGAQAVADSIIDAALEHARARLADDAVVVVLDRH